MEIIVFEQWNFLVWKRYWPLYSRIKKYYNIGKRQPVVFGLPSLLWLFFFCYSSLNLLKEKCMQDSILSERRRERERCSLIWRKWWLLGMSRVAGTFLLLSTQQNVRLILCGLTRQKNGSTTISQKCLFFFIHMRRHFFCSFLPSLVASLETYLIFINNIRWANILWKWTFLFWTTVFCFCKCKVKERRATEGQRVRVEEREKTTNLCEKNTWVLA